MYIFIPTWIPVNSRCMFFLFVSNTQLSCEIGQGEGGYPANFMAETEFVLGSLGSCPALQVLYHAFIYASLLNTNFRWKKDFAVSSGSHIWVYTSLPCLYLHFLNKNSRQERGRKVEQSWKKSWFKKLCGYWITAKEVKNVIRVSWMCNFDRLGGKV